jgi:hypothetical protein
VHHIRNRNIDRKIPLNAVFVKLGVFKLLHVFDSRLIESLRISICKVIKRFMHDWSDALRNMPLIHATVLLSLTSKPVR